MVWYKEEGYEGERYLESYFKKKKTDGKFGFFSSFNKRWFMLDFDKCTLSYSTAPKKKISCVIPFKDILRVKQGIDSDKMRLTTSSKKLQMMSKQLTIYTVSKVYELFALENNTKSIWAYALKFIVKSKTEQSNKKAFSCVRNNMVLEDSYQKSEHSDSVAGNDSFERNRPRFMSAGRMDSLVNSPLSKAETNILGPYQNGGAKRNFVDNIELKENMNF
jgi:hypothetical protein